MYSEDGVQYVWLPNARGAENIDYSTRQDDLAVMLVSGNDTATSLRVISSHEEDFIVGNRTIGSFRTYSLSLRL